MNHKITVEELRKQLEVTTDPTEYDRLQEAIHQAEKSAHLHTAGQIVAQHQAEAAKRAQLERQHESNMKRAQQLLDGFVQQDQAIDKAQNQLRETIQARYDATQAYTQAVVDARYTAELLGLPEPVFPPRTDTTHGDLSSAQHFAKSLIERHMDEYNRQENARQRQARLTGKG